MPIPGSPRITSAPRDLRAPQPVEPRSDPAQEIRVAEAVARGLTNPEVAAELFVSPKTIEFHLGRVYRKLGIHSRTELATVVARGGLEADQPKTT